MTTFSIIDFTPVGAFCAATNAANESDRNSRASNAVIVNPTKTASLYVTVREQLEAVIQSFRKLHTETA